MKLLVQLLAATCVATVVAQLSILTMLAARGNLRSENLRGALATLAGIDVTGTQLATAYRDATEVETPSYDEILQARALAGLEMDMRHRAQSGYLQEIRTLEERLRAEQDRFDTRRAAFNRKLEELLQGVGDASLKELQRTLEALPPKQAKDQLLRMLQEESIDQVVAIVKAMPLDKRKKILSQFTTPEETERLGVILQRISEGEPERSLIEAARSSS
jgi:flagellar motility protein MotE (MotC chaperone)